ncbi:MAG: molybdenum cofactor guanylyltransferase MobA [Pseudohaliea sp.]
MPAPPSPPVLGLLLAGGAGRRAGGVDKGLLPFGPTTLAAAAAGRLRPQVEQLLVACNRHPEDYAALGDGIVRDRRPPYQGPLAGVEAVLPALREGWLLALAPCDVPGLPADLVARLRAALPACDRAVAWARADGRDHYLCALLTRSAALGVTSYLEAGGRSVRGWYATLSGQAVAFPGPGSAFANYNTGAASIPPGTRVS